MPLLVSQPVLTKPMPQMHVSTELLVHAGVATCSPARMMGAMRATEMHKHI